MSRHPDPASANCDTLYRFLLEGLGIRGELVHLDATWKSVLERRSYPEPLRNVLGECMGATALLAATIKLDGTLIAPGKAW